MTRAEVLRIQVALIAQGYPLPRWGADGVLGEETEAALATWAADHGYEGASIDAGLPLLLAGARDVDLPVRVVDHREDHPGRARRGINPWTRIDTICLHQMACCGSGWERWKNLAIHYAILRSGWVAWLNDCNALLWHGHGWNGRSVGLEIEGWYAGVESDPSTLWTPAGATGDRTRSQALGEHQAEAALQAIDHAVAVVAAHGGQIRYVAAHRQSSSTRRSDPGSQIWQAVALPAMDRMGLTTAPTLPDGWPIPDAWDPAQVGVRY
uniref:Putative N-acetylmuramoyl-L-alanine amidase n=1 Tax=viral metagenome TaxID=1070528 RepID=A0A6M3L070_9ZZZZ